jgi:glycosyltransferase involved in cell wall biosynthesis
VCEAFGVPPERVRAVPHGVQLPADDPVAPSPDAGRRFAKELTGCERYVLALGTVEPRKDLPSLVRAWDRMADGHRHQGVGLVIAGPDGWGAQPLATAIAGAHHNGRIGRTGYVEGAERLNLLAGADVLAYPSRYEGFGLPPLEAMRQRVPVVTTDAGALREVCGDAALLVPVGDEAALADALERVLDDDGCREGLVERGAARAATFTWDRCADGLLGLYEDAARG